MAIVSDTVGIAILVKLMLDLGCGLDYVGSMGSL
jgi:hypothetical protein